MILKEEEKEIVLKDTWELVRIRLPLNKNMKGH